VVSESAWHYTTANWEPLKHAAENVPQFLILVDYTKAKLRSTAEIREGVGEIIADFRSQYGKFYAFVVGARMALYFDLQRLDGYNVKVFCDRNSEMSLKCAKEWLHQCTEKSTCPHCGMSNRYSANFCKHCGGQLW